jgi:predicted SAM-dependent methyltransferase
LDVLEHIVEDFLVVDEISRILKPNGKLLISVPEDPRLWSNHDIAVKHIIRYNKKGLVDLFSAPEVRVNQIWSTLFLLRPAVILARKTTQGSDLKKMNFFLNSLLYLLCLLEIKLPKYRGVGVTLWVNCQKKISI